MANDLIVLNDNGRELKLVVISINKDKNISLIHTFEENYVIKKKYIRSELVLLNDEILTSNFSDTIHFFEELNLFDFGNSQNKYLDITEYKSTKNLKLRHNGSENIFISKSEAKAMCRLFNMALQGYSLSLVLENEFIFTPQILSKVLHENEMLGKN